MKELSDDQIGNIIDLFKKGVSFPEDYRLSLIIHIDFDPLKSSITLTNMGDSSKTWYPKGRNAS